MDNLDKLSDILVVLLKHISVNYLVENKLKSVSLGKDDLRSMFLPYMNNYSDTEMWHILLDTENTLKRYGEFYGGAVSEAINLFHTIFNFTDKILVEQSNEILCKYVKLLRWRSITSRISEETLVMAFIAKKDLSEGVTRKYFTHKPVISHNNFQLKSILNEGISENHFHLRGSSPYFQLSWIQLMNEILDDRVVRNLRKFENYRRNVNIAYNQTYKEDSFEIRIRQAFLIRLYLFARLTKTHLKLGKYRVEAKRIKIDQSKLRISFEYDLDARDLLDKCKSGKTYCITALLSDVWNEEILEDFKNNYYDIYSFMENTLTKDVCVYRNIDASAKLSIGELIEYYLHNQSEVLLENCRHFMEPELYEELWNEYTLRYVRLLLLDSFEMEMRIPEIQESIHSIKCVNDFGERDYAMLLSNYVCFENEANYIDLWGERVFLYYCFRKIRKDGVLFSEYESNLFHAYLVIKENIRSEMVQANEYVGFENFQIYEKRKTNFSSGDDFEKNMARMAVKDTILSQNIISLEARVSPKKSAIDNCDTIDFFDHAIDENEEIKDRFFYTFHFIKAQDTEVMSDVPCECRHYKKRYDNIEQACALREFREKYPEKASRVLGIDAASQEIGCRPEVFAVIFRALKSHMVIYGAAYEKKKLPQLRISYHVGEDFLDILDGLRAIDEAIHFLNLDCGDRLGHALALGIDVKEWYRSKKDHIALLAQDYLDNVVWLYHAIVRYEIEDKDNLKSYLESEFSRYFNQIYGGAVNQKSMNRILKNVQKKYLSNKHNNELYRFYAVEERTLQIDINTYYKAWQLRGDHPELYKQGFCDQYTKMELDLGDYSINLLYPPDNSLRYIPEVAYLYHLYHYSRRVRIEGRKEVSVKIRTSVQNMIDKVQKKMQHEVSRRGLGIESNPSSNYMIGTFKRYAKHPITTFYNVGLVADDEKLTQCPQISVSINTDDQGVFSASLENEYALMARALEKERDDQGQLIYNRTMIYEWINNIRINGNRQSFNYLKTNEVLKASDIDW